MLLVPIETPLANHWYCPFLSGNGVTVMADDRLNGAQASMGLAANKALESLLTVTVTGREIADCGPLQRVVFITRLYNVV